MRSPRWLVLLLALVPALAAAKKPPPEIQRLIEKDQRDESLTEAEQKKLEAWQDAQDAEEERAMEALEQGLLKSVEGVAPKAVQQELKFACPAKQPPLSPRPPSLAEWNALLDRVGKAAVARAGPMGPRLVATTADRKPRDLRTVGAVLGSLYSVSAGLVVTAAACRKEPANVHCAANLASMLDGIDDDASAASALAWALSKDPKHPLPLTNLAWLQFHRGDFVGARARFEGVQRALGPSPVTDQGIGLSAYCLGDRTTARTHLRRTRNSPAARVALDDAEQDNRSAQRRQRPRGEEGDGDEDADDGSQPDPNEPAPGSLERLREQRPELPEPPIAASAEQIPGSAKAKLELMKTWLEDMKALREVAAAQRPAMAREEDEAGLRVEGNRLVMTLDDSGADDAWERVRDYYRARFWKIVRARRAALAPILDSARERNDQLRKAMGACMQSASRECAVGVCGRSSALREATLQQLVPAWRPHHDALLTLIGDYGQLSSATVSLAHGEARHRALDANRQWQVLNWLHDDWGSAVALETDAGGLRVELCPDQIPPPPRAKKKVVQKPAKPGCPSGTNGPMIGGTIGPVSLKANCTKLEVGLSLDGFVGSIGHDRSNQTTTLFLGVGAQVEANPIQGFTGRAVAGGSAGFYVESTAGHISDFGVRATGGTGDLGGQATVGFGVGRAVDGYLASSESGGSVGQSLEAAVTSGCTWEAGASATVGPLSLDGVPIP